MSVDTQRLLLELDRNRRIANQENINPVLQVLELKAIVPVVELCAKARARYIECLMSIANDQSESGPSQQQIEQLKKHRISYTELVDAANALEAAIERGYLDVKPS